MCRIISRAGGSDSPRREPGAAGRAPADPTLLSWQRGMADASFRSHRGKNMVTLTRLQLFAKKQTVAR